jgi:hypothetical protein
MGLVIGSVRDHAAKELEDLRAERLKMLEKAAELSREIAAVECHQILGAEHAAAESKVNGKPAQVAPPPAPPSRTKPSEPKE